MMRKRFIVSYDLPFKFFIYGGVVQHSYLDRAIRKNVLDCINSFERIGIKNVFLADEKQIKEFDERLEELARKPLVWHEFISETFSRFKKEFLKKEFKTLKSSKAKKLMAKLFYYDMKNKESKTKIYEFEVILPDRKTFKMFLDNLEMEGRLR